MKKVMTVLRIVVFATVLLALVIYGLYRFNVFVFDDSAVPSGKGIEWNGARYVPCEGKYELGKAFAKMNGDDARVLYAIEGDDSYRYFVAKAMRDPQLYIREDLVVPENGTVTGVYLKGHYESDAVLLKTLTELFAENGTKPPDGEEVLFMGGEHSDIVFCYDGCPIGTSVKGMLLEQTDVWVSAQYRDGDVHYTMLTDQQVDVVKPLMMRSAYWKLMYFVAVVTSVAVVLICASVQRRKRQKR